MISDLEKQILQLIKVYPATNIFILCVATLFVLFFFLFWLRLNLSSSTNRSDLKKSQLPNKKSSTKGSKKKSQESLFGNLNLGLAKTRNMLQKNLEALFSGKSNLDEEQLEKLHEILYRSDLGVKTVDKLIRHIKEITLENEKDSLTALKERISHKILEIFEENQIQQKKEEPSPHVILIVGVNGVGKTTTIGKLASHYKLKNKSVLLCAADTYRAAAVDQLKVWGKRIDVEVVAKGEKADPAAVAFDATKLAKNKNYDVLIIDTAGRLQSDTNLMEELGKINRVVGKELPGAPHDCFIVVDATTGQNAFSQVSNFQKFVNLSGIIVTKLDGTAKGGVVIGISDQFHLPIRFIGVGEKSSDFQQFNAKEFVKSIFTSRQEVETSHSKIAL
ncbi:MAG: signal recognition particle-docking protein FtsY [Zetaproteobacteria bacterium]|nr:signal recognition particle-docking protein FtsY [Pseudobdellovibrionaceae bacterium]